MFMSGLIAATAIIGLTIVFARQKSAAPAATPVAQQPAPQLQPAPAPAPVPKPAAKTYENSTYGFSVQYPETILATEDKQDMQLSGYVPVCDPDHAIVCFPFPKETYKNTNFEDAAFAVHVRPDLKKQAACESPDNGETADGEATLNGVSYKKFAFSDAAAGHRLEGENYRVFRSGSCIELSTRVATTVFENYEPGMITRFTEVDRSSMQAALDDMLKSFRFVSGS